MQDTDREFEVILWGATGFTGQLVAEYMVNTYGVGGDLKWAIAGRSADKLAATASAVAGNAADKLPQLIANSNDADSITSLVEKTKVICTTVGPYALYGSVLVEACAKYGTHCCDLTGEVPWMRTMIDQHQTAAEASGAKIVFSCGFDCIPADLGVFYLQQSMLAKHDLPAREIKFRVVSNDGGVSGGTVATMMNMMEEVKHDASIVELLADPYALNPLNMPRGPDGPDQSGARYDTDFKQWTGPFIMAAVDTRVVRCSNALMKYQYGNDFHYNEAILTGDGPEGYVKALLVALVTGLLGVTTAFSPTRNLLKSVLPSPGEGPSRQTRENGSFEIELIAKHPDDAAKDLRARVTGDRDPGYGATSKMLAESAVCLALDDLEVGGGIWTPASAMGEKLINRLQAKAGMTFDLI